MPQPEQDQPQPVQPEQAQPQVVLPPQIQAAMGGVGPNYVEVPGTGAAQMSSRDERLKRLKALQEARGSDVLIAYVTSTRPGVSAQMAIDAIRFFKEHMPSDRVDQLDLLIHSNGGDSTAPWRLMTLLREYAKKVTVLVPHRAFSAATLAALGADEIVMHPMGMLGPIDPTVTDPFSPTHPRTGQPLGVSVEDVAAYIALVKDDIGIRHEDELVQAFSQLAGEIHPLTLGHSKRGTAQARMLGEKLLRLRDPKMDGHRLNEMLEQLTTKLYYHGHPINRKEAKDDLQLHVAYAKPDVEKAMWEAYLLYEEDMRMNDVFDPISEALTVPGFNVQPNVWTATTLGPMRLALVESATRTNALDQTFRIAATVDADGGIAANMAGIALEWSEEP